MLQNGIPSRQRYVRLPRQPPYIFARSQDMDSERFADLVRSLMAHATRRGALGTALLGALGALGVGWQGADARKRKRKKKKKCRGCPTCKKCVKGRCRPVPDFTPCGGDCQECQGGQCVNKANDSACDDGGKCLDGVCNPRPECTDGNVGGCEPNPTSCCSGTCDVPPPGGVCQLGSAGAQCKANSGCISGSCIGFRCAA
jgi:hypothetical protein